MIIDFLNSPLIIFILIPLAGLVVLKSFRMKSLSHKRCKNCGERTMQQAHVIPEGIMLARGEIQPKIRVKVKVKYQCTNCKEFIEVTENRRI